MLPKIIVVLSVWVGATPNFQEVPNFEMEYIVGGTLEEKYSNCKKHILDKSFEVSTTNSRYVKLECSIKKKFPSKSITFKIK